MSYIEIPFDGRPKAYDQEKLATAVLVYMDTMGAEPGQPTIHHTKAVALMLRNDHGFATDSITYAVGARICIENGIDPYQHAGAVAES